MHSIARVFSNFREFYSEINGATLTGAIDVIVVEQPDGEFQCSPFHVRFGKMGVLRSRAKVVDIEINGEPVDIHMKLGESGEAFFVEECPEEDVEELPENLATSPIPTGYFPDNFADDTLENEDTEAKTKSASDDILVQMTLPLPRRNSIDFSKDAPKIDIEPTKFENQVSDYSQRRHTDNTLERRNLSEKLKEFTTQKLRQEWAEHEEIFQFEKGADWVNSTQNEEKPLTAAEATPTNDTSTAAIETVTAKTTSTAATAAAETEVTPTDETTTTPQVQEIRVLDVATTSAATNTEDIKVESNNVTAQSASNLLIESAIIKDESKSKKRRRKKSQMKKKNTQRKSSSSSSLGSNIGIDGTLISVEANTNKDGGEEIGSNLISNKINLASIEKSNTEQLSPKPSALATALAADDSPISENDETPPITPGTRIPDLDIHFFSDTEVTTSVGTLPCGNVRAAGRPSTPIQSDSELEISLREKETDVNIMTNSASWKWGELPTPEPSDPKEGNIAGQAQAQRNSMLSGMFNFMKKTNKIRQQSGDGGLYLADLEAEGMNPEMAALYFPNVTLTKEESTTIHGREDDRESGNGTSLPHSPSSVEGQKSIDSDYEDGKLQEGKYLDFVAMSLCGGMEKGEPTDEEFDRHIVKYADVCEDPSLFSSPNLVVRLNGKYYSWAAACPLVMTTIIFHKPLPNDAMETLIKGGKHEDAGKGAVVAGKIDVPPGQTKRSWWYWRRSQTNAQMPGGKVVVNEKTEDKPDGELAEKDADVATQTSRPISPDVSENTLSKTESTLNAENTSRQVELLDDLSTVSSNVKSKNERFKKTTRLSSDAIKKLNLKEGMNEIEFSVTTAYQGTSRAKCYLFRWKHSDKVVISDIDGTITKSDVLGHILPMVGKDWAQLGVAQLFSKIEQNGYKLLYLSARAIGQSRATREYLRSIRQGNVMLPNGPLLLNPTSLISAFHREVIEKKPEEFKIACLSDIRDLFPDKNPFYAGYGNRINDVWAYRAVGIPTMRIFTINTKGELKHELTQTFQSSYSSMTYIVDQFFPPIKPNDGCIEYSSFNFWRDPIPEIDIDSELAAASAGTTNGSENGTDGSANSNASKADKKSKKTLSALSKALKTSEN